jgi:PIN domain nuclease of toxin-antitoxin system
MIVLDATCLIAFLLGEAGAEHVGNLLTQPCAMSVSNRAEVLDKMIRRGADKASLDVVIDPLGIKFVGLDQEVADRGALLRAKHYHHTARPVSMADCMALALAKQRGDALATSDQHLATIAHLEGVAVRATQNSQGITPTI